MLPLLMLTGDKQEHKMRDVTDQLADQFELSDDERKVLIPSGTQALFYNRVGWARTYLVKAGLLETPRRGFIKITKCGLELLNEKPEEINNKLLKRYPAFRDFQSISTEDKTPKGTVEKTPEELIEEGYQDIRDNLAIDLLTNILQLIALQLGGEVSRNEIASKLNTSRETVERYLDLLEKAFVVFRLKPLSRNRRNEIARKEKIYFYDTGIRNSIISAFQPLDLREDRGALFENFMIAERLKCLQLQSKKRNLWFWRTHDGKEIDYIEEYDGRFNAYELKWGRAKIKKTTADSFKTTYDPATITIITRDNYYEFLLI